MPGKLERSRERFSGLSSNLNKTKRKMAIHSESTHVQVSSKTCGNRITSSLHSILHITRRRLRMSTRISPHNKHTGALRRSDGPAPWCPMDTAYSPSNIAFPPKQHSTQPLMITWMFTTQKTSFAKKSTEASPARNEKYEATDEDAESRYTTLAHCCVPPLNKQ